jgi:hypothetical protein
MQQDRQCTCIVTMKCVRVTTVCQGKQEVLHSPEEATLVYTDRCTDRDRHHEVNSRFFFFNFENASKNDQMKGDKTGKCWKLKTTSCYISVKVLGKIYLFLFSYLTYFF